MQGCGHLESLLTIWKFKASVQVSPKEGHKQASHHAGQGHQEWHGLTVGLETVYSSGHSRGAKSAPPFTGVSHTAGLHMEEVHNFLLRNLPSLG